MARALVVYYSRTGITERAALSIKRALSSDIERVIDPTPRGGVGGYLRSVLDGTLGRLAPIEAPTRDPSQFDVVLVGTPVWNGSPSSPVRAYLERQREAFRNVAFFCTCSGRGADTALWEMSRTSRLAPIATLVLRDDEILGGDYRPSVDRFVREALGELEAQARPTGAARGWAATAPAWER
jgi:hypothetical protein